MGDFTYTVFLVVASVATALVTVFAAGVIGVLLYDAHHASPAGAVHQADASSELPHAA